MKCHDSAIIALYVTFFTSPRELIVLIPHRKPNVFLRLMPKTIYTKSKPSRVGYALVTESPFKSMELMVFMLGLHHFNVCFINAFGIYKRLTLIESVSEKFCFIIKFFMSY